MIETYSYTNEQLSAHTNQAIDLLLRRYLEKELITMEQFNELSTYQIVIAKKGFFSRFFNSLWVNNNDATNMVIVKIGGNK